MPDIFIKYLFLSNNLKENTEFFIGDQVSLSEIFFRYGLIRGKILAISGSFGITPDVFPEKINAYKMYTSSRKIGLLFMPDDMR